MKFLNNNTLIYHGHKEILISERSMPIKLVTALKMANIARLVKELPLNRKIDHTQIHIETTIKFM